LVGINPHISFLDEVSRGNIKDEHGVVLALYDMKQHEKRMPRNQKRLDTFCICMAVALFQDHRRAAEVRCSLVLHFAKLVFGSTHDCTTVNELLEPANQRELVLAASSVSHPAIQQWVYRQHLKDKKLHKSAKEWYAVYPDFMRTQALLFIRDHKKSSKGRIKCKFTFALLAADLYGCKVCFHHTVNPPNALARTEKTPWYFSKQTLDDADDAILEDDGKWYTGTEYDMQHATSVIMYHANRSFNLLQTAEHAHKVALVEKRHNEESEGGEEETVAVGLMNRGGADAIYVLRKFNMVQQATEDGEVVADPQNHALGDLVPTAPESCIFIFHFGSRVKPEAGDVYQIYPKHEVTRSHYLHIPDGCKLYVFLIKKKRVVHYTGQKTDSVDVPPHFKIQDDTDGVMVVTAPDEQSARDAILEGTDLVFETKTKEQDKKKKGEK